MPIRRLSGCALFAASAFLVGPGVIHGQSIAGIEIDRVLFMVATKGPDGKWSVRETDRVPLRPRNACYGWRLHFSKNTLGKLAWREEFTLPGQPGKGDTLLVRKKSETPQNGWLGNTWCVTKGDPVGEHVIKAYVQDSLARAFTFFVVAPEELVGQDTARGVGGQAVPLVDPLGRLGDFSTQRASLEDELEAKYPKPPSRLDTDPTTSAVLLIDIDLKGALGRVDGAAVVMRGDGGEPIRTAPMKGDVVMFHTLEPGAYSLRFIRVENYNPAQIVILERPPSIEIDVTVAGGGIHYLGTVVVSRKKIGLFGFKPPEFQVIHDARRELAAWSAFKQKYAEGPWTALAERRIVALTSP